MQEPTKGTRAARFGAFEVNFVAGELRKRGFRLKVQEQPFQVLVLLLAKVMAIGGRQSRRFAPCRTHPQSPLFLNLEMTLG
jgi:hypothetical protein